MSITYIPRVTQLDSIQLDKELEDLLKNLLFQATKYFEPGVLQPILPELDLLIRTWIFKNSVCDKSSTFGQQMLSLKYKTDNFSRRKLYWYFFYTIWLRYMRDRAMYSFTSNMNIQNFFNKMETFQLICEIINFLRFIQSGKHPALIDFILGFELTADKLTREDLTDFSWTRELLWHNLIELIGTVLSLVNMFGLRQRMSKMLKYMWWRNQTGRASKGSVATMTLQTTCACCSEKPILPHVMGCSHVFCYYCLMANKTADPDFVCPKCYYNGKQVTKFLMM
ncbi:peroxisome biogenesis factor 2 [Maniola jurtina]|uniref:peroxisome biogenesis factor 2 n=1 Tax=Maniola jurtina TaxID=191418 RepID=UPI001E68DCA0|nr:peroxisome biogenesis factor 2 [Maniola jurtina]XP_045764837.1 peroxisome biogenesis factor 2 [Maniola jurtina]